MVHPIPLVAVLWQDVNFGGVKRIFVRDEPDFTAEPLFNDEASAIGVHPGPDFELNAHLTISFFQDIHDCVRCGCPQPSGVGGNTAIRSLEFARNFVLYYPA